MNKRAIDTYMQSKEYLNLFESLDYEYKIRLAREHPELFGKFNKIYNFVKWCEEMGINKKVE